VVSFLFVAYLPFGICIPTANNTADCGSKGLQPLVVFGIGVNSNENICGTFLKISEYFVDTLLE
jgi:hypothetical protein